ncbi:FecR family protein [Dysgonomonas sp. 521]|uniref:FecR family protein n=1 Tax=Dysgonomonas sp. 521 TaxID=2302932 RepID=UPI0013D0DBB5|nr:FecR family protein [Dysgonomonas sp. 521]
MYTYRDFLNNDKFVKWQILQTEELNQYWIDYQIEFPQHKEALDKAVEVFKNVRINNYLPSETQQEALLDSIRKDTLYRKRRIKRLQYYAASVACIAVLVVSTLLITHNRVVPENNVVQIIGETQDAMDIQFISTGKPMILPQDVEIQLTENGDAAIVTKEGENIENLNLSSKTMNKLIVPLGKRSSLILADGTKVWLNSGTQIEFPSVFDGQTRDINIRGEIFIDVAKNDKKPFYIHTSQFDIQVTGTKFNVSAYDDAQVKSVVLVEGQVKIHAPGNKPMEMKPNDRLTFDGGAISKDIVDTSEYISWKTGILNFKKASLADILNKVGRHYNVNFKNLKSSTLSETTCSGKLVLAENIDSVMIALSVLAPISYSREGDIIYIKNAK